MAFTNPKASHDGKGDLRFGGRDAPWLMKKHVG